MYRTFFKRARSGVTVQALAIVVRLIELDVLGGRRCSKEKDVDMSQPAKLGLDSTKHGVIRVACVAGFVRRNAMILKMCGGEMLGVVHAQTLSVRFHDVARKTEFSTLCVLQFAGSPHSKAKKR